MSSAWAKAFFMLKSRKSKSASKPFMLWKAKETLSSSSHQDAVFLYKIVIDKGTCATLLSSNLSALSAKFCDLKEVKKMTFVFPCEPHAVLAQRNVSRL